ncbi:targeting protein for Xklp2-like isoform X1 [Argonauta hians]
MSEMQPKWEFECPQFVDFTQNVSDQDDSDTWFDIDHEADSYDDPLIIPEGQNSIIAQTLPVKPPRREVNHENVKNAENTDVPNSDKSTVKQSPLKNRSNIASSVEEFYRNKNKPDGSDNGKENVKKSGPRRILRKATNLEQPNVQPSNVSKTATNKVPQNESLSKDTKKSEELNKSSTATKKYHVRRSISLDNISKAGAKESFKVRRSGSSDKLTKTTAVAPSNVRNGASSSVPKLKENLLINSKVLSSEAIEQQKMEIARSKALAAKRMAEESLKKVKNSKGYQPVTSNKKLTVAKGFQFSSDRRLRSQSVENVKSPISDLSQILRKDDKSCPVSKVPTRTIVQPFKFAETSQKTTAANNKKFMSVAEQINNFSRKTPDRFRSRNTKETASKKPACAPRCTIAISPEFNCKGRSRPVKALSQKEKEELELEEIKKNQFKAREVNHKIFLAPSGVKEVPKKEPTIIKPFNMPGAKITSVKKAATDDDIDYRFRAQPVPTEILKGVVGVKESEHIPLTIPASPAFALKQRIPWPRIEEPKQENLIKKPKYRPYIHSGIKFEPKLDHRFTSIEPFTFDERMQSHLAKKEEHIKKQQEENLKMSEFYANPIPNYKSGLPTKKSVAVTKQEPFKLLIEERVEKRIEEKQRQLEEEARLEEEKLKFKAQPCDIVNKAPFVPKLDHKFTADVAEFKLNTELRKSQREQYFEQKKAHDMEMQAIQLRQEQMRKEEEEKEIQRLRADAVHKAKPIRRYKAVDIQHNVLPITIPVTPKFCYKTRARKMSSDN